MVTSISGAGRGANEKNVGGGDPPGGMKNGIIGMNAIGWRKK
jgi:hypothetical protein